MHELVEDEWAKFKFVDSSELELALFSPLIILPALDDKVGRKIPSYLQHPQKDVDIARLNIKMLFNLRHLLYYLTQNDDQVAVKVKQKQVATEVRAVQKWQQDEIYQWE